MTRFHYIYRLTDPSTGCFYIGKRTCCREPEKDAYSGSGYWPRSVRRLGRVLEKKIVAICDSERDAYALERLLVAEAKRKTRAAATSPTAGWGSRPT